MIVEATGDPKAGIRHALKVIEHGKHVVMVNVEADVVAGPLLASKARAAGVIYSLAWGDQPALICEHVDWARACGFEVVSAGKGTRYHPTFHQSTPDTVWDNFGLPPEVAARGGMNPKMFNSFIDGTKSGIEMTAVCNATGLTPQPDGLSFPPSSVYDLAKVCKPKASGGKLAITGTTEVVSSLNRDKSPVANHLQVGTYVVVKCGHDYVQRCAQEYNMLPDETFEHMALYRPTHMIGLELGISVASAALRKEPTGAPTGFRSDVVATAKKNMKKGEMLDGEGGYLRVGQADAGRPLARRRPAAARPRAQRQAQARHRDRRAAQMGRRRIRPERFRREGAARDGGGVRAAECLSAPGVCLRRDHETKRGGTMRTLKALMIVARDRSHCSPPASAETQAHRDRLSRACRTCRCSPRRRKGFSPSAGSRWI